MFFYMKDKKKSIKNYKPLALNKKQDNDLIKTGMYSFDYTNKVSRFSKVEYNSVLNFHAKTSRFCKEIIKMNKKLKKTKRKSDLKKMFSLLLSSGMDISSLLKSISKTQFLVQGNSKPNSIVQESLLNLLVLQKKFSTLNLNAKSTNKEDKSSDSILAISRTFVDNSKNQIANLRLENFGLIKDSELFQSNRSLVDDILIKYESIIINVLKTIEAYEMSQVNKIPLMGSKSSI